MSLFHSILKYFMKYEYLSRFVETQLSKKAGETKPIGVLQDPGEIKQFLNRKKCEAIKDHLIANYPDIRKNSNGAVYGTGMFETNIRRLVLKEIALDDFLAFLKFTFPDNKKAAKAYLEELLSNEQLAVAFPLMKKRYQNKDVVRPLFTFACQSTDQELKVEQFQINRATVEVLVAFLMGEEIADIRDLAANQVEELLGAMRFDNQPDAVEIVRVFESELFQRFGRQNLGTLFEFPGYKNWQMLQQVFITTDGLEELDEPIFRKEIARVLERSEEHSSSLLQTYLDRSKPAKPADAEESFTCFHLGSYQEQYPINEKQWRIVNAIPNHELLSVNGPPGTGKTTLIKESIADIVVRKAIMLIEHWETPWRKVGTGSLREVFTTPFGGDNPYSMMIASTNNKAVDNIGDELLQEIPYFSEYLPDPLKDKGLFCAVLGKRENVDRFKGEVLAPLLQGLDAIQDQEQSADQENLSIEQFRTLHLKLQSYKAQIESFLREREEFLQRFPYKTCTLEIVASDKASLQQEAQALRLQQDNVKCQHEQASRDLKKTEDELKRLLEEKPVEDPSLLEHIRSGYRTMELFKERKGNKLKRWLLPNWRAFFKKYPSEAYIETHVIKPFDQKREEQEKAVAEWGMSFRNGQARLSNLQAEVSQLVSEEKQLKDGIQNMEEAIRAYERFENTSSALGKALSMPTMIGSESQYQLANLAPIYKLRNQLFKQALLLMQQYIRKHHEEIVWNLKKITEDGKWFSSFFSPDNVRDFQYREGIMALWETFFLCFPVVTTTLHSFRQSNFQMLPGLFETLFVDEAGQILPHYLVGPLYRAKRAVIVGDTEQIEPIRSLRTNLISEIQEIPEERQQHFCVEQNSAQHFSDRNSDLFETIGEKRKGIILVEHRRCEKNIIRFSNEYVYNNVLRIIGENNHDKLYGNNLLAFDVRGGKDAMSQQNEAEVEMCRLLVEAYKARYGEQVVQDIAIITPFLRQAERLEQALPQVAVGTVHKFQGQEKKYVLFTTVLDSANGKQRGLADFIGGASNLLNVALSRAKEQFVLVGNLEMISQLRGNHLFHVYQIIREVGLSYSPFSNSLQSEVSNEWKTEAFRLYGNPEQADRMSNALFNDYLRSEHPQLVVVNPQQHNNLLLKALATANRAVTILSPWVTHYVVNDQFLSAVREAKARGVEIKIGFGYQSSDLKGNQIEEIVALDNTSFPSHPQIVQAIRDLHAEIGSENIFYSPPFHTKLLLVDGEYVFVGSHNWLSNNGYGTRGEVSCMFTNRTSVDYLVTRYVPEIFNRAQ